MLSELASAFVLGLATPLTAVCVIPLYPGFISYLASSEREHPVALGALVTLGAVTFMFLTGLIFTYVFAVSLTNVIGVITPALFVILAVISVLLITGVDFAHVLPSVDAPTVGDARGDAFLFGLFFGGIALPCNPGMITALFSISLVSPTFITTLFQFLLFGAGMGTPLLALAAAGSKSTTFTSFLTRNKRVIDVVTGAVMLVVSLYYLIWVFNIV